MQALFLEIQYNQSFLQRSDKNKLQLILEFKGFLTMFLQYFFPLI
jgi:hypothetical protein